MRRISRHVEKISTGDFSQTITLRGNDAIQPLADELNYFIGGYRKSLAELMSKLEEFKESSQKTGTELEEGGDRRAALADKAKELGKIVEHMKL